MICTTSGAVLCGCNKQADGIAHFPAAEMDATVDLGNDFYQYSNGGWMKQHPLPADKSRLGTFDILAEDNNDKLKSLVEEAIASKSPKGTPAQKIADLYTCGMDTAARNKAGYEPIKSLLELAEQVNDNKQIAMTFGQLQTVGVAPFFYFNRDIDAMNSTMNIASVGQAGIGLPDRDYYFAEDPFISNIITGYKTMLVKFATLIGMENAEARVEAVYELEKRIAEKMYTRKMNRDPQLTYNKFEREEFEKEIVGFEWEVFFESIQLRPQSVNATQLGYFKELGNLIANTDKAVLSDYIKLRIVNAYADYLSDDFVNASFDYRGRILSGTQEMRPLWKRILGVVNNELLGQLFVEKYFPANAKQRMVTLIENLRTAFSQRIDSLKWMGDATKAQAKEKLAAISVKVGYPDVWEDYSKMEIDPALGFVGNLLNVQKLSYEKEILKIDQPVDKNEWFMTPQTVNAYYNPSGNEIVFPAGILQPPFFYAEGDDAVNYGAIGVVIGHEMTHGFDDMGCQYDKDGNLNNWWTEEDSENFKAATQKLVERFNTFTVIDSIKANGELTLGENIADLGGLCISHQAFINSLNGQAAPVFEGQTADQRFCLAYSRVWATNIRPEHLYQQVKTDPHSPAKLRVNGSLPLVDYFYTAFGIKEDAAMYVPSEERIEIW